MAKKSICTFEGVWDDFLNQGWNAYTKLFLYSHYLDDCFVNRNIPTPLDFRTYLQRYVDQTTIR